MAKVRARAEYGLILLSERVSGNTSNRTTNDTILITGIDPHFSRRICGGGTVIRPPAAPTAITAAPGAARATVKWKAPTATNGAGVTSYRVTALAGGVVKKVVTYTSPLLSETMTGLLNGTAYTFEVVGTNVAGTAPVNGYVVTPS